MQRINYPLNSLHSVRLHSSGYLGEVSFVKAKNDIKKEYLREYRDHVNRIHRIDAEIRELRELKASAGAIKYTGMPSGSNMGDLSDYGANLDELERSLIDERYHRIRTYKEIVKRIKKMRSRKESDVLFYRYIAGLDWWEIAEKMGYSERQIHRIHGAALAHFEPPKEVVEKIKDVIECQ